MATVMDKVTAKLEEAIENESSRIKQQKDWLQANRPIFTEDSFNALDSRLYLSPTWSQAEENALLAE